MQSPGKRKPSCSDSASDEASTARATRLPSRRMIPWMPPCARNARHLRRSSLMSESLDAARRWGDPAATKITRTREVPAVVDLPVRLCAARPLREGLGAYTSDIEPPAVPTASAAVASMIPQPILSTARSPWIQDAFMAPSLGLGWREPARLCGVIGNGGQPGRSRRGAKPFAR